MRKLTLILGIVLCTTLSYGQDVKIGNVFFKEYPNKRDTLDIPTSLVVYSKDSIVVNIDGIRNTFIVDSIVTPQKEVSTVDVMYTKNKIDGQIYEVRIFQRDDQPKNGFIVAIDNVVTKKWFLYEGLFRE